MAFPNSPGDLDIVVVNNISYQWSATDNTWTKIATSNVGFNSVTSNTFVANTSVTIAGRNILSYTQAAFDAANTPIDSYARDTANASITLQSGINTTQNTRLTSIETVNTTQNTNITAADTKAQAAFDAANSAISGSIDQFARDTANNVSSNTLIVQGVNVAQNTRMSIIEGVNTTQNTNIQTVNDRANTVYDVVVSGGSVLFNGTNQYATVPYSSNFDLSSSDWTMEAWFNSSSFTSEQVIIGKDTYGINYDWGLNIVNTTTIRIATAGTAQNLTATVPTMLTGQWYHVAIVRNGSTTSIYLNGVSYASSGMSLSNASASPPTIGCAAHNNPGAFFNGYISNLRIVKGVAVYTGNFTPSTTPLTSVPGTSLLTCQSPTEFIDSSGLGLTVTKYNSPTVSSVIPFASSYRTGILVSAFDKANSANLLAQAAFNKANTAITTSGGSITGSLNVSQDLSVTGNLIILGTTTSINTSSFVVNDSLLVLGTGNYTSDLLDIGLTSHYNDGTNAHAGFIRDASTKEWYVFQGYTPEHSANNNIDINHASFAKANVHASYFKGNVAFSDGTIQTTAATGIDSYARTTANTATSDITIIQGVDTTQNTRITTVETKAQAAFDYANTISGGGTSIDSYARTTANTNATNITIIQGVDIGQNTRMSIIEGVNTTQNTNITVSDTKAQNAYNQANTANNIANTASHSTSSTSKPTNPVVGDFWFNQTNGITFRYTFNGSTYFWLDISSGIYTNYDTPTFTGMDISYLIVAGGGGGGGGVGGGGGAGGVITGSMHIEPSLPANTFTITIGGGGDGGVAPGGLYRTGDPGGNTTVTGTGVSFIAIGGGGGAGDSKNPTNGGSGGGGSQNAAYGLGVSGQGYNGGSGIGGGGGAGGAGIGPLSSGSAAGGPGILNPIQNSTAGVYNASGPSGAGYYIAGGGGGIYSSGGLGGGAAGAPSDPSNGSNAYINTGGGGGGGRGGTGSGGNGGSGIAVFSVFPSTANVISTGTYTTSYSNINSIGGSISLGNSGLNFPAGIFRPAGDFTIESWIYPVGDMTLLTIGNESSGRITFFTSGSTLYYNPYGTSSVSLATNITQNEWQHIAIVRTGTSLKTYRNGILQTTGTLTGTIGNDNLLFASGNGYISNYRLSTVAAYASEFTPNSTQLLTSIFGTVILTAQSSTVIQDNSGNDYVITPTGSVTTSQLTPISAPTTSSSKIFTFTGSGTFKFTS